MLIDATTASPSSPSPSSGCDLSNVFRRLGLPWVHRAGERWKKPGHATQVVLRLNDGPRSDIELVGFWLGLVRVFPAREYEVEMGYLGPDLLADDFDVEEAIARIEAELDREIGRALLDQRKLAGIGNEYRAEINFLAGTHPRELVRDAELHVRLARRLMWRA